jgi:hypothetical protein
MDPVSSQIIRSKRRSLALQVQPDGSLVVRAPHFLKDSRIQQFIDQKKEWIEKATQKVKQRSEQLRFHSFEEGELFLYLGHEYPLHLAEDMFGKFLFEDRFILSQKHRPKARRIIEKWYREEAFMVFTKRCQYFAGLMGVKYRSLSLSSAKSRWGCCTPHGTLRFCWRLVMAPMDIIDYVVVHELAHLKHLDHSARFWQLVREILPNYEVPKNWLKDNGSLLSWMVMPPSRRK